MCVGPPTVPNMQTEPRFDDGRTFWKRKVYSLARTAEGIGKVRKTPLVKLEIFFLNKHLFYKLFFFLILYTNMYYS